jgi:hypothetical protein
VQEIYFVDGVFNVIPKNEGSLFQTVIARPQAIPSLYPERVQLNASPNHQITKMT